MWAVLLKLFYFHSSISVEIYHLKISFLLVYGSRNEMATKYTELNEDASKQRFSVFFTLSLLISMVLHLFRTKFPFQEDWFVWLCMCHMITVIKSRMLCIYTYKTIHINTVFFREFHNFSMIFIAHKKERNKTNNIESHLRVLHLLYVMELEHSTRTPAHTVQMFGGPLSEKVKIKLMSWIDGYDSSVAVYPNRIVRHSHTHGISNCTIAQTIYTHLSRSSVFVLEIEYTRGSAHDSLLSCLLIYFSTRSRSQSSAKHCSFQVNYFLFTLHYKL